MSHYLFIACLLACSPLRLVLAQATCPQLPDTGVTIGQPVPIVPGDIPKSCSDFEILVARGTSEPSFPKFGIIVGDPVVSNASKLLPGVQGYPVQYPASFQIISGGIQGVADIVKRLTTRSISCPNQTFSLVGYSQGASIMHQAASKLPPNVLAKIKSVVMFGDPDLRLGASPFPDVLRAKLLENCAKGDPVCDSGDCQYYHLTYIRPEWINRAVNFIVKAFEGNPLPPSETIGLS